MRFLFNLVWFWACLGECSNVLKFVTAHEDQYFLPKNGASRSQLQSSNTQLNWLELKGGVAGGKAISMKKRKKKQQEGKDIAAVVPHQVQSKSSTILRSQLTALVTVDSVLLTAVSLGAARAGAWGEGGGPVDRAFWGALAACVVTTTAAHPALAVGAVRLATRRAPPAERSEEQVAFGKFQKQYLFVQLLSTFTEFIQGAYLYKLYESYGYQMKDTATLYLSGFVSALLGGFAIGKLIDRYGRRKGCVAQLLLNAAQCQLLRSRRFPVLLLGRVLSGVASSLATAYECWLVSEHLGRGFAPALLADTMAKTALGLGAAAVLSGVLSGALVERWGLGPRSVFDLCSAVSLATIGLVLATWNENFGARLGEGERKVTAREALHTITKAPKILFLGITQCMFDSAMMLFVFMWTPLLLHLSGTSSAPAPNLGLVFSCFMIAIMIGSSVPKLAAGALGIPPEKVLLGVVGLGGVTLASLTRQRSIGWALATFLAFEVSVGAYFPLIGALKAQAIPERLRATIMNIFKVATNAIVICLLRGPVGATWPMEKKQVVIYVVAGTFMLIGFSAQICNLLYFNSKHKNSIIQPEE